MTTSLDLIVALLIVAALAVVMTAALVTYLRYRGARIVTCPETKQPAAVSLDAARLAIGRFFGSTDLRLATCSRWPEREGCGQECLAQIRAAPNDCLVRTILTRFYEGKSCALCRKPFGTVTWTEHHPALLTPAGQTIEWRDVRSEDVPDTLKTHRPVCWNCHVVETFIRQNPDLVLERPDRHVQAR